MRFVFVAINATHSHTNLAVRSIASYIAAHGFEDAPIAEFNINLRQDYILEQLFSQKGDCYLFSCYIWNIALAQSLALELKKLLPSAVMIAGGPEVSYSAKEFLQQNPAFSYVINGEGEETTAKLLASLSQNISPKDIAGITYRHSNEIVATPKAPPVDLNTLPFAYKDLDSVVGKTIYYESIRGCPFNCSYCISSLEKSVRFKSLDLVYKDLDIFIAKKLKQLKFVDRTFNCNKAHSMAIWRYLIANDNGTTNFHFEIAANLLDDEMLKLLSTAREGLFQLEIGIQSTNQNTLAEISRPFDGKKLFDVVKSLNQNKNIHLHLDLIAGLPFEDYQSFKHSFNAVYSLRPQQLQIGFLKVLKGSVMEKNANSYHLIWRDAPPYEVLQTSAISFEELASLHRLEEMVDHYFNSGRFNNIIKEVINLFETPFDFYLSLSNVYRQNGGGLRPLSATDYYEIISELVVSVGGVVSQKMQWLCKYDMFLHQKTRKLPSWVTVENISENRRINEMFFKSSENIINYLPSYQDQPPKKISKLAHLELFDFDPQNQEETKTLILFDYKNRDIFGNAKTTKLELNAFNQPNARSTDSAPF